MKKYIPASVAPFVFTAIGRLRIIGFLEGLSLLVLVFVAVPAKYIYAQPSLVRSLGPVHGMIFLLFVFNTLRTGIEQRWKFSVTTWKVLLACIIPFGTFYIDRQILSKIPVEAPPASTRE